MKNGRLLIALLALALCACQSSDENVLLGTLERERVSVAAEAAEAIIRIDVSEGDTVSAGQSLLALDARRSDARLAQAEAELRRADLSNEAIRLVREVHNLLPRNGDVERRKRRAPRRRTTS